MATGPSTRGTRIFYYVEIMITVYLTIAKTHNGHVHNFEKLNKTLIMVHFLSFFLFFFSFS